MISRTAEYALRTVIWLAAHPNEKVSTARIAEQPQMPKGYLSTKILPALTRAGLVVSTPGRAGGVQLARDPQEVTLLDVIRAVDPSPRVTCCPLGLEEHAHELCALHRRLDEAAALAERAYAATTVAEVAAEHAQAEPLCETV